MICYMPLFFFVVYSNGELQDFNITILYQNTTSFCTSCIDVNRMFFSRYTDIPPMGDPNNRQSQMYFTNPLPPGYLMKRVTEVVLVGGFKTSLEVGDDTLLDVSLGLQIIQKSIKIQDDFISSSCHNCHVVRNFSSQFNPTGYWPDYNYNYASNNLFSINVLQNGIALSSATIYFKGQDMNPYLTNVTPHFLPSDSLGYVSIHAQNIHPDLLYKCSIAIGGLNTIIDAQVNDKNEITCNLAGTVATGLDGIVSKSAGNQKANLTFYPDVSTYASYMPWANGTIGPVELTLYAEPTILNIYPQTGNLYGKDTVQISGIGFQRTDAMFCQFGDKSVQAWLVDETNISCVTPAGIVDHQTVVVGVSLNGQSWTYNNSVTFTYLAVPLTPLQPANSPKSLNLYVIIICSCVFGIFGLLGIGYFVYTKRLQRLNYVDIPDIDSSAVINPSELDIKERIGRGSFGDVYRAYWRFTEVAVKKIHNPSEILLNELYDEARLMISLRHPNIVTFMACTVAKPDLCIVTEYVSRGSLYKILHDKDIVLELDHVRMLAVGASKGMAYLHGAHILHRDLKSHNLLVDTHWNVKVGDFGLSRAVEKGSSNTTLTACGTPCWTAPEVLRSQRYSFQADVYSFGVCLWEMVTREDPYPGLPPYQVVIAVATKNLRPNLPRNLSPEFEKLITECWSELPENRPNFGNLIVRLNEMKIPKVKAPPVILSKGANAKRRQTENSTHDLAKRLLSDAIPKMQKLKSEWDRKKRVTQSPASPTPPAPPPPPPQPHMQLLPDQQPPQQPLPASDLSSLQLPLPLPPSDDQPLPQPSQTVQASHQSQQQLTHPVQSFDLPPQQLTPPTPDQIKPDDGYSAAPSPVTLSQASYPSDSLTHPQPEIEILIIEEEKKED